MKKIIAIVLSLVLGAIVGIIMIGLITPTDADVTNNDENNIGDYDVGGSTTRATTLTDANTTNNVEKTIGDITIVDDFECQIKEVNWYSASDFDYDCIESEEGFEYIVIVLSEKNTTNETQNAPMSNLLSADDKECVNKIGLSLYKKQYKMNFGATMACATAESYVIYQIPSGANSFKFQILSNGFASNSDYIVFDRGDIQ